MSEIVLQPHVKTQLLREYRLRRRIVYKLAWMLSAFYALATLPFMVVSGWLWAGQALIMTSVIIGAVMVSPRFWRAVKGWRLATLYGAGRRVALGWAWREFWADAHV